MTLPIKLSVCIATYKRATFIGETLDSILHQMKSGVELIIVDGASPDNTPEIMAQYLLRYPNIRYYREATNSGVDRDYDKAVGYAQGEYCWLMTDDDLLCPGAINRVLSVLDGIDDLMIVNAKVSNADFKRVLYSSWFKFPTDRKYGIGDSEKLFVDAAEGLSFIGGVVIKREVWLSRNRSPYYGSLFIHMGVIFQKPPIEKATFLAEPLIHIRYGNAMWSSRGFEVWMFKWPELLWSFKEFSNRAISTVSVREPWRQAKRLIVYRAIGGYSLAEYRQFVEAKVGGMSRVLPLTIAIMPPSLLNTIASLYILLLSRKSRSGAYDLSRSRHSTWLSRLAYRILNTEPID